MRSILAGAVLLAFVGVGAQPIASEESSGGWDRLSSERREVALVNQLGTMSLATSAASLLRRGKTEQAIRMLERTIDESIDAADQLTRLGTRLPSNAALPSLAAAPRRARTYALENDLPGIANRAAVVDARLK